MDNIFIKNIKNNEDGSVSLDFSVSFKDNNTTIYGNSSFSSEEAANAFKKNATNDYLNGFKILVISQLMKEITTLDALENQTIKEG